MLRESFSKKYCLNRSTFLLESYLVLYTHLQPIGSNRSGRSTNSKTSLCFIAFNSSSITMLHLLLLSLDIVWLTDLGSFTCQYYNHSLDKQHDYLIKLISFSLWVFYVLPQFATQRASQNLLDDLPIVVLQIIYITFSITSGIGIIFYCSLISFIWAPPLDILKEKCINWP